MQRILRLQILPLIALALLSSMNAVRSSYAAGSKPSPTFEKEGGTELVLKIKGLVIHGYLDRLKHRVQYSIRKFKINGNRITENKPQITEDNVEVRLMDSAHTDPLISYLRKDLVLKLPSHISKDPNAVNLIITKKSRNVISLGPSEQVLKQGREMAIDTYIAHTRYHILDNYKVSPEIRRIGQNRINIRIPGKIEYTQCSDCYVTPAGSISFHTVNRDITVQQAQIKGVPPGFELVKGYDDSQTLYLIRKAAFLNSSDLNFFRPQKDELTGQTIFSMGLNAFGTKKFAEISRKNLNKPIVVVFEKRAQRVRKVLSAPVLRSPILNGVAHISGKFSYKEAKEIAARVRPGNFDLVFRTIEERKVLRKKE